jgi:hypothetical protein
MNPDSLLEDIGELIQIPEIFQIIHHKVEELKGLYTDNIEYYKELGLVETKSPPSFDGESFQITRKGKKWETSIDIPQVIVDFIVNSDIKPGIPMMKRRLQFPGISGRYTITFEMQDDSTITGTIQVEVEKDGKEKTTAAPPAPGSHLKVLQQTPQKDDFKEFLFYLLSNKGLYEYVIKVFRLRWKPAIDYQLYYNNGVIEEKFL